MKTLHKNLYIVIVLNAVAPLLIGAARNNQANSKQNIVHHSSGIKAKYGNWSGKNGIVKERTTTELSSNNVGDESVWVTAFPKHTLESDGNLSSSRTHETSIEVDLQEDIISIPYKYEPFSEERNKDVFKSVMSKNDIPLGHRPLSKEKSMDKNPYVDTPSPCRHGGTFLVSNGKYSCQCGADYSGVNCEIHSTVCHQPIKLGGSLPCAPHGKSCRPVPGGGFVCKSDVASFRNTTYHNMSNLVECVSQSLCPDGWECLNINPTTDNYRCDPPLDPRSRLVKRSANDICQEDFCQHGAQCTTNKCVCLINYNGRYCEKEINYCASNPCKEGISCEPHLGGYNCNCPATHIGIRCDIRKRISLKQMVSPRFLYLITQYSDMTSQYCFYATSMGDLARVTIAFGDDSTEYSQRSNITRLNNPSNQGLKTLFPTLNFLNTNPQLIVFTHAFKNPGFYNVTVEATNAEYLVYRSVHTVRVESPARCKVTTKLRNCVQSVGANITIYSREDHIVILSDTTVNCSRVKLGFVWSLHSLETKFDRPLPSNKFNIGPEIVSNQPHLNVYPYSLPFGVYAAEVSVTITKVTTSVVESALTWFRVKEMKIEARLVVGSLQQVRWTESAVFNASMSYNPNMPPNKQRNLLFTWKCAATRPMHGDFRNQVDTFCPPYGDVPLSASGPVLIVPPRSLLLNWEYVFSVHVREATEAPELHNLTESMVSVVVEVVGKNTPILTIKCVRNCENDAVNPSDTAVLEAVCSNCMKNTSNEIGTVEWVVTSMGSKLETRSSPRDEIVKMHRGLGLTSSTLVLDEGVMIGHERLIVSVHVKRGSEKSISRNALDMPRTRAGAERMINIASPPETGYCNIAPQQGYAMLTSFHIFCYNFKDNNPPLEYQVMQFTNYTHTDTNLLGTFVGYDVESEIHDVRLASGLPEYDHITLIRTTVSSKYIYTFYDFNVTVFPVVYHLKSPIQVLNFLTHMVEDEKSNLARMHDSSNLFANIQMIKVVAESAVDLLTSDYVRYIDTIELTKIIESIQDHLANFLNQQQILNVEGLKHFVTALDAVLKLPRYHIFSASNVIGGKLFAKVVDMLTNLKDRRVHLNKPDVEDLAPQLMSAASNLLRMPQDLHSRKFRSDDSNKEEAPEIENQEEFSNFTQNILKHVFAYARHIIPYKANHEKGTVCESGVPDMILSVQRNSPKTFSKEGLYLEGLVGMVPVFSGQTNTYDNGLSVFLLYIQHNPFWWHPKARDINYPLVQLLMYDTNSTAVNVPTKVKMQNPDRQKQETIHGQLAIHPYWTLNDVDIQVNRIQVPKGGKLIVQFMPIIGHHKIQVIVKKGFRPELIDFWDEANVVPHKVKRNETETTESYTVYVEDESTSDEEFYYIGVLPHIDTLHALIGERKNIFRNNDEIHDDEDNDNELEARFFQPKVMQVREDSNNSLPFEYAAYSIRCLGLNMSALDLNGKNNCQVRPGTTLDTVYCKCDDLDMVTASIENLAADLHMARSVQFHFPLTENPLTFYLIFFIIILFFLLFLWALWLDGEDKVYRDVIFLADNDPRHSYSYLVIVQTGRRPGAGTTSDVATQLIGENGNSQVHVLRSAHRPVLTRGSQEWFVLKTEASLGNIVWINLWHDHLEASPYWYCSKVIVHDIQSNEVWFFLAEQWFTPLYGDGTMSCSVYNTTGAHVFEKRNRFGENLVQGIGAGYHVWLSPFYKTPGGSYTRCQRVLVTFTHTLIMLLFVIHLFDRPTQENSRLWTDKNLYNGLRTALLAFPLHFLLAQLFVCVAPKPPWTPVYWRQCMMIDKRNTYLKKDEKDKNADGDRYHTVAYTVGTTKMTDTPGKHQSHQSMIRIKAGEEFFCLPHWVKYILWIVVTVLISVSIFFIYFNGIEHSTGTGYSTVVTLVIAILFSMLLLEMLKVIIYAVHHAIISGKEILVEDRSDLAVFLEDEYKVESRMIPKRLEQLEEKRREEMYRPIVEPRLGVLQRNAIKEASARSMITDIGIVLLFIFLLLIALHGIIDSQGYLNVRNVKNVIQGRAGFGRITLDKITEREGFLNYINASLIPNLYAEENYNGSPLEEKGLAADFTNYLVGVPRLRQIRVREEDCKEMLTSGGNWASRCKGNYLWLNEDTADYDPSWKNKTGNHRGTPGDPTAWIYQTWWSTPTAWTPGVITTYTGGGYVAHLGRNRRASWQALDYLRANNWFDRFTVAVFLEFTLFNPNRNLASAVRILAEDTVTGGYTVHSSVQIVKIKQVNDIMPFIIFALFALLVIALILCVHRDGFRIKELRRWTYFGNIWYALNIVLAIMGVIVAFCLLERTLILESSLEKLREPNVDKYVQFNVLQYWDQFLIVVLACMLFTVILQSWHLLSVEYKCHLVMTVLQVATHSLLCYVFLFALFLCAFTTAGHLLFVSTTFQFRNLLSSFVAMAGFAHRDVLFSEMCFFFVFFVTYFFLFRWGFVVILMEKFRRVSLAVLRQPVRHLADSLMDAYVRASFRDSLARLRAMERIVESVKQQRKIDPSYGREFIARSREIAMAAVVIDHIEGRMQYRGRTWRQVVPDDHVGPTIRNAIMKERKATALLATYLKLNKLEATLDKLYYAVDRMNEYDV